MKTVLLFFALSTAAFSVFAQDDNEIVIGERHTIHSEVLGEDRPFLVHLPSSYDAASVAPQHYPVLYLLDGGAHFHSVSGVVQFMSAGINGNVQIPEHIIVAIPNTNRTRDLTPSHSTTMIDGNEAPFLEASGGGEAFLRFMKEELMPHIEATYRTRPYRVFVGHSFGGLLVLHTLLEHSGLFHGLLAIDPSLWWDDQSLVKRIDEIRSGGGTLSGQVFITLANNPNRGNAPPKVMELSGRAFGAHLASMNNDNLRSGVKYYPAEDHGSVPLMSLYDGLLFIFEGFKPNLDESLSEGPGSLAAHYQSFSKKAGMDFKPPETFMNMLGFYFASVDSTAFAGEAYKLNVENYPGSWNANDNLANFYLQQGDTLNAIKYTKISLELNPESERSIARLRRLSADQ